MLAILLAFTIPASAEGLQGNDDPYEKLAQEVSKSTEITDPQQKKFFFKKAEKLIKANNKAKLHIASDKIAFSDAKLLKYESDAGFGYVVAYPVLLENSHEMSNISLVFNAKKQFVNYTEFYLTENSEGNFNITQYIDGKENVNKDTDIQFQTIEEFKNSQPEISLFAFDINKLASCLGISAALATTIAAVCGLTCVFTAGLGCIACLSFSVGFNIGGNISCFQYAWK
jgi:hypothetical protein